MSQSKLPSGALKGCVALVVVACILLCLLLLTPLPRKVYRAVVNSMKDEAPAAQKSPPVEPEPQPEPEPEPVWSPYENDPDVVVRDMIAQVKRDEPVPGSSVNYKSIDTTKLWNGITVNTEVVHREGGAASEIREDPEGYEFDFTVKVTVPQPVTTIEGLAASNPHLPAVLPGLAEMVSAAQVSPMYSRLYEIKTKRIQQFITRLNAVPDRHNFYDCETLLEMEHPVSKQKVFFVQGDMDVVSDGSDGDRMPEYDEYIAKSSYYQPFTSYGWPKKTRQPNPLLSRWEEKLAKAEAELAAGSVRASRLSGHKQNIAIWKREIADLKARSYLIARADPFVVIPTWMRGAANPGATYAPNVGDYAAVVYENRIYPAIVGDTGPTWKVGEASLRVAKELNPKSSPYSRPVSKLHVSYVIFPGTRDKADAPDLAKWHAEVAGLLEDIGGLGEGIQLHEWSDYLAERAAAAPSP